MNRKRKKQRKHFNVIENSELLNGFIYVIIKIYTVLRHRNTRLQDCTIINRIRHFIHIAAIING